MGRAGRLTLALGLMVGGCSMFEEITAPAPGNISALQRPASPNTCLAAPAGFTLTPDLPTGRYDVPPERLLAVVRSVVAGLPRTTELAVDLGLLRADYVVRSRVFRFPDIVLAQALPASDGRSDLVLYSYSLKGHYDFGVNRARVVALLTKLDAALDQPQ